MDEKVTLMIIADHEIEGLGYRILAAKYGMSREQIHRIVMSKASKKTETPEAVKGPVIREEAALPDDKEALKEALRQAHLKIELQDLMLDIASREFGVDIRKKSGAKPSR
jgi:hypothetical protein